MIQGTALDASCDEAATKPQMLLIPLYKASTKQRNFVHYKLSRIQFIPFAQVFLFIFPLLQLNYSGTIFHIVLNFRSTYIALIPFLYTAKVFHIL